MVAKTYTPHVVSMARLAELQAQWKHLYYDYLPSLAKARDPVQSTWPVYLDHCFARIVLDNAVGVDRPWTAVVKQPAVKNMTTEQLGAAIALAERVAIGEANLVRLNETSLEMRGKLKRKGGEEGEEGFGTKKMKRSNGTETISSYFLPSPPSPESKTDPPEPKEDAANEQSGDYTGEIESTHTSMSVHLKRIADSNLTPFRKQMLVMLCQIPRGRYSTYQAMSDHITKISHKTCARAVGNAMRNNPFAPEVPCHRVLAHDGTLGGFKGHWGENGAFASKKHELLHQEGVRFDSRGKVKGPPFRDFK